MSTDLVTLESLMTPEYRAALLKEDWAVALNAALAPFECKFDPVLGAGSKMFKESSQYKKLDEKGRKAFINDIKVVLKEHRVGERMTQAALARGFWIRFNSVLYEKNDQKRAQNGAVKQLNVSLVHPDIKASPAEKDFAIKRAKEEADKREAAANARAALAEQRAKQLEGKLLEAGVDVPAFETITAKE